MAPPEDGPLLRKIDCVQIPVPDLDTGLRFYRDGLGLELKWRHATQAGLRLGDSELVLQTERPDLEPDFLVFSAEEAARRVEAGWPARSGGRNRVVLSGVKRVPNGAGTLVVGATGAWYQATKSGRSVLTSVRPPCRAVASSAGTSYPVKSCAVKDRFTVTIVAR